MAEPFLAEIRIMSFNFAPKGWAMCNGQFLPINQNQALFALLGTMYGGNGQTTFALPNLRGKVPIHFGSAHTLGEAAGSTSVTINATTMPQHAHFLQASNADGAVKSPLGNILARHVSTPYTQVSSGGLIAFPPTAVTNAGGSQPHNNMMPFLTLNFCIALQGIFPSQT
jgi:microcystin-dependent protein